LRYRAEKQADRQTDRQANTGENPTYDTAVGVGKGDNCCFGMIMVER